MQIITMSELDLKNKRVLIREDLNVPLSDKGQITSDIRIKAALPTIQQALDAGAAVILISHLGRPEEGKPLSEQPSMSLAPVAEYLKAHLNYPVNFCADLEHASELTAAGQLLLLENSRILSGEKKNIPELAKKLAKLCDIFVMDAFATAHRAHASTHGVAQYAPIACAGPLLMRELDALEKALSEPARPLLAIVGGAKVSTKLTVLESLSKKVDQLLPGGGIANTFLKAAGFNIGGSLHEPELVEQAKHLMSHVDIPLPTDVRVAKSFAKDAIATTKFINEVEADDLILDIGPATEKHYATLIKAAGTIIWNGPVGVFEFSEFSRGTEALTKAIADSSAFSIAGGGDTLAAIDLFEKDQSIKENISYISTGGGAFLEYVQGDILPAVEILMARAAK